MGQELSAVDSAVFMLLGPAAMVPMEACIRIYCQSVFLDLCIITIHVLHWE